MSSDGENGLKLKKHAGGLLIALTLQYILGMITNLFVKFPKINSEGKIWEFAWSQLPLAGHIIIGLLILFGSLILMIRAILSKNMIWRTASVIGFIAVLLSGVSGATFVVSQSDGYSFSMSVGFIVAFIAYFWGIATVN
jgi:hypothetical protein